MDKYVINKTLNIITPCGKPEALPKLFDNIYVNNGKAFDIKWWIVFDPTKVRPGNHFVKLFWNFNDNAGFETKTFWCATEKGSYGNEQRNFALDHIMDGWVLYLDDDNLIHPALIPFLNHHTEGSKYDGIICGQDRVKDLGIVLNPLRDGIGVGKTDGAMCIFKKELIGDVRWGVSIYEADGLYAETVWSKNKEKILLTPNVLSYFNALK